MQAWYTAGDRNDRAKQAAQFKAFVDTQHIDPSEPVLFAGDFNTDWVRYPGEVAQLVELLNASIPTLEGAVKFTSDPSTNVLVGRDGAASKATFNCQDAYERSWGPLEGGKVYKPSLLPGPQGTRVPATTQFPPLTDTRAPVLPFFTRETNASFCPCCPNEWLDYILWSNEHQAPLGTGAQPPVLGAINLKLNSSGSGTGGGDPTTSPLRVPWDGKMQPVPDPPLAADYMQLVDLSDHYPVYGKFEFAVDGPANEDIFGCRKDSDCSFHTSFKASCYCDGVGCTWDGKHVDGWKEGAQNPVNDNCHYHLAALKCACHKV